VRLVIATDKFRGTATAQEVTDVIAAVAQTAGWSVDAVPMSDGGEGLLEVFGGANRRTTVTGPLGRPVDAEWFGDASGLAVIESARASGLQLAGGRDGNDAWAATSRGTGELIVAARAAGATRIIVGLGGSACTDGGRGAVEALEGPLRDDPGLAEALTVCHDVDTPYLDAAAVFGPQKGADRSTVERLEGRLRRDREWLVQTFGIDPHELPGSGAAGGLGGALAAAGGRLVRGFDHLAAVTGLASRISGADLVITGEGRLDRTSLAGKVVGGVTALARDASVRSFAIVGACDPDVHLSFETISLSARFGEERALTETLHCVELATRGIVDLIEVPLDS
jgi:glycerate kinase